MSFLQSAFLYGLALVAIPLLLHLLTRRKVREVVFPAMMFLIGSRRRSLKLLTLSQWLILLCRTCAIAALAIAAALPVIEHMRLPIPGLRIPMALHVIIDNTPSMGWEKGGVSLMERGRAAALKIIDGASGEDTITMETACGDTYSSSGRAGKKALSDWAGMVSLVSCDADISMMMNIASKKLKDGTVDETRLIVISDFQKRAFRSPVEAKRADKRAPVVAVDMASREMRPNVFVKEVNLPLFPLKGENVPVCYSLAGTAGAHESINVSLMIEGEKRGERQVDVDEKGNADGCFSVTLGELGRHAGVIEVSGDELPFDNRRWFTLDVSKEIYVLLLASDKDSRDPGGDASYLLRALRAASGAGPGERSIKIKIVAPEALDKEAFAGCAVVVIPDGTIPTRDSLSMINDFVASGGGVFITSSGGANPGELISDALFSSQITTSAAKTPLKTEDGDNSGGSFLSLGSIDADHPIFRINGREPLISNPSSVRFDSPANVRVANPNVSVIASLSDGRPLIIEKKTGAGKVVLFASAVKPVATSFSLAPSFIPFTLQLTRYLSESHVKASPAFTSGRRITIEADGDAESASRYVRNAGTGAKTPLKLLSRGDHAIFEPEDALPAGAYEVVGADEEVIDAFVVNGNPDEGVLDSFTETDWDEFYPADEFTRIDARRYLDADALMDSIYRTRGVAAWFPFLLLAAFFLILETFISSRR